MLYDPSACLEDAGWAGALPALALALKRGSPFDLFLCVFCLFCFGPLCFFLAGGWTSGTIGFLVVVVLGAWTSSWPLEDDF